MAPGALLARADAFFARRKRGYTVKVRESGEDADLQEACEAHGLVAFGDPIPQMICRRRLERTDPPPTCRCARSATRWAWPTSPPSTRTPTPPTGCRPRCSWTCSTGPDGCSPVRRPASWWATGAAGRSPPRCPSSATAWAACNGSARCADARHLSLGRLVTEWATNAAFDRGATSVTLQSSAMGEPLYARLGYETQYHYREYVRWEPPT